MPVLNPPPMPEPPAPRKPRGPTEREADLLQAVTIYTAERGYPPAVADVAVMLGLSVTRATTLAAACLERGWLVHEYGRPRSWRVVGPDDAL